MYVLSHPPTIRTQGPSPEWTVRQAGYNKTGVSYTGGNYGSRLGQSYLRSRSATLAHAIEGHFGEAGGRDILEIGCGTGLTLESLGQRSGHRLVGMDFSSTMLREAGARTATSPNPATLLLGNAIELPFEDASFDAIYATRFIHQFPHVDKLRIAAEIERVLRPGGLVALEFYARTINRIRYHLDQHHKYATRELYFSHYPSSEEVREIVGPDFRVRALRYFGDRLVNRVLGYQAFSFGEALVTRFPLARWLMSEHWVFYTPRGKQGELAAARKDAPADALAMMRCPSCRGPLSREATQRILACGSCRRAYALEDGVPNLLSHEARPLA
ncbi:MAG TPA: methyltransferase domain-containing protein [Myxococcota bacterium]